MDIAKLLAASGVVLFFVGVIAIVLIIVSVVVSTKVAILAALVLVGLVVAGVRRKPSGG